MPLDSQTRAVLDDIAAASAGQPAIDDLTAKEVRAHYRTVRGALRADPPAVARIQEFTAPGPAGLIPIRYYRPAGSQADDRLPILVYFHGGGWIYGDLDSHEGVCCELANRGGFAVASVDYRLAPEAKFPAGVEDAYAAVKWIAAGGDGWCIDTDRIAVGGDSAGGNLAAVLCLMARGQGPGIAFQALLYPSTRFEADTPSSREFAEGYMLTARQQAWVNRNYLNGPEDIVDWRASPLLAEDLSGLPPALVLTGGFDPLRDEGRAYADRLRDAGVAVSYKCFDGQIHGFLTMGRVIDEAAVALQEIADALKAGLQADATVTA